MQNFKEQKLEELRELYLHKSPDDDGLVTRSITFSWGKFNLMTDRKQKIEFYLATKESIEEFISQTIDQTVERVREETIEHISVTQGWEETGDFYRSQYGLKKKFEQKVCGGSMIRCKNCEQNYCNGCFGQCPNC